MSEDKEYQIKFNINKYYYEDKFRYGLELVLFEIYIDEYREPIDHYTFFRDPILEDLEEEGELDVYHRDAWDDDEEEFETKEESEIRFKELITKGEEVMKKYLDSYQSNIKWLEMGISIHAYLSSPVQVTIDAPHTVDCTGGDKCTDG